MNGLSLHQAAHASRFTYGIEWCFDMVIVPGHAWCLGRIYSFTIIHFGTLRCFTAKQQFRVHFGKSLEGWCTSSLRENY